MHTERDKSRESSLDEDSTLGRPAEKNPDDFPEAGEKGIEAVSAGTGTLPAKEMNPDDFPEAEQEN
ncbi:hypothetical protein [Kamptonema formosum]|uniref:hypothetical protein n=1 Tax=Kamptonema formosum TaxID=331992 RepID=UPI00034C3878|nr:hypothetical protein [Oscillatoria sp. PCC 10802]